jgi:hypothetical protein
MRRHSGIFEKFTAIFLQTVQERLLTACGATSGHAQECSCSEPAWVPSSQSGVRILQPTRYPYRIYYTVQGDGIVIPAHSPHVASGAWRSLMQPSVPIPKFA